MLKRCEVAFSHSGATNVAELLLKLGNGEVTDRAVTTQELVYLRKAGLYIHFVRITGET